MNTSKIEDDGNIKFNYSYTHKTIHIQICFPLTVYVLKKKVLIFKLTNNIFHK